MSRKDEFKSESKNPSKGFLEWKSNDKCFKYWDRYKGENVDVYLPLRILVLKEMSAVKGWSNASDSGIYSNEVKNIGTEEVNVRSFKGGVIAKGLYKDVKEQIKNAGGHYVKSIYFMKEDGTIWNMQIKGSAVQEWGEFTKKSRMRLSDEWVVIEGADERKKGSINYSVPVFKYDKSLSDQESTLADSAYTKLDSSMSEYLEPEIEEPEFDPNDEDEF